MWLEKQNRIRNIEIGKIYYINARNNPKSDWTHFDWETIYEIYEMKRYKNTPSAIRDFFTFK